MKPTKEIYSTFIDNTESDILGKNEHNEENRNIRNIEKCTTIMMCLGTVLILGVIPITLLFTTDKNPSRDVGFYAIPFFGSFVFGFFLLCCAFCCMLCAPSKKIRIPLNNCLQGINAGLFRLCHKAPVDPTTEGYTSISQDL